VTSKATFQNVGQWLTELREHSSKDIVLMLLGNKTDLGIARQVTFAEAEAYAKKEGLLFAETSAKDNSNVEEAFKKVIELITITANQAEALESQKTSTKDSVRLEKNGKKPDPNCCKA